MTQIWLVRSVFPKNRFDFIRTQTNSQQTGLDSIQLITQADFEKSDRNQLWLNRETVRIESTHESILSRAQVWLPKFYVTIIRWKYRSSTPLYTKWDGGHVEKFYAPDIALLR